MIAFYGRVSSEEVEWAEGDCMKFCGKYGGHRLLVYKQKDFILFQAIKKFE